MNRELARRIRVPLGFLLAAGYLVVARPTALTLVVGASIAFAGLLIRAWAAGHIVKNDRLATTGPYAHTRNPLYFGSFLIAAGFAIAAHWSLLLFVIAFFVLIYGPTIRDERVGIRARFPEAYEEWERNVPPFVPRPTPWRPATPSPGERTDFDFQLYMRHGEWRAALGFLAVLAYLILRMRPNA
ncbi:MAG TPA: isoprenylcysteine carboxylmethyltransferase family protein [Gemmatimonadaceae bacterium]|nr:isoprenylcysteine carboxylmethyltransferase family protein [Gemmatimonadaceae bacterium]